VTFAIDLDDLALRVGHCNSCKSLIVIEMEGLCRFSRSASQRGPRDYESNVLTTQKGEDYGFFADNFSCSIAALRTADSGRSCLSSPRP